MSGVYTVEVYGDNNTFTLEVTPCYEPNEDWLTGRITYRTEIETALLVHGNRRREVTDLLNDQQRNQIIAEIDRQNLELQAEKAIDRHFDRLEGQQWEYEHTIGRFIEDAGIC
jgi:hypothetical protein